MLDWRVAAILLASIKEVAQNSKQSDPPILAPQDLARPTSTHFR
jgi:hypothetical protein